MRKFGPGSQILGTVQASFLHQNVDGAGSSPTADSPDASPFVENEVSPESRLDTFQKSWEEPPLPRPLSERKTPDVRLPGAELRDEEDEEQTLEKERRAKEIVNYLQHKWDLQIDKKSSLKNINYRTVDMLLHQRPPNHWLLKRARQKIAEHTGFFSDVTKPYEFLGVPEMDGDMLLFHNLPDSLKISSDEWLTVQLHRQGEKEKRNARLTRIPYVRSKRSAYARGRVKRGAGGITQIERLIKNGEGFQRDIRGTMTFTKLLEKWFETKEEEMANRGSPFGQVKRSKVDKKPELMPDLTGKSGSSGDVERDENGRIIGPVMDEKVYEEFVNLEKMMTAMYYLVKSMINVKMKQITSQNRIPYSGVMELRSRSPTGGRRRKNAPVEILDKFNKNSRTYEALQHGITGKPKVNPNGENEFSENESETEGDKPMFEALDTWNRDVHTQNSSLKRLIVSNHSVSKFEGSGRAVPNPFNPVAVGEIYPLSTTNSAEDLKVAVGRVQQIVASPSYLDDRPYELRSATLRKERPLSQGERIRRHYERFRAMFQRHEKRPETIWWNVYVRDYKKTKAVSENEEEISLKAADSNKSPLLTIPRSGKIPDLDEIPTPKLPGPPSIENLSSEEQSRLNLLATIPDNTFAEPLESPIRKLYAAAGIQTMDHHLFEIMMSIKRRFRFLEKSLRVNITSELEKYEWDVLKRYKAKIPADCAHPIYEKAIGNMRRLARIAAKRELYELENTFDDTDPAEKQPAPWFRDLIEMCDQIGALKHHGCSTIVYKLLRYCDLNSHSKPYMLRRFCLLVVSLPANELASPFFHKAIIFLLDHLFGSPVELLQEWLQYRGLKPLIA